MTTAPPVSLRANARGLALEERKRRHATAQVASDWVLLGCVVAVGVGGGEWRSNAHCAAEEFAVSDRTFRRWLEDKDVRLPQAVRAKLLDLAWAFAVEVG